MHQVLRIGGGACRDAAANDPSCAVIDGIELDAALVDAHEGSWLAGTLALQRGLDDDHPLEEELWPHTHNSYNADAYGPTLYGLDRNQIYSVGDQLRMGIRAIELDVHWAESVSGDPANGFKAVVVCHGERVPLGPTTYHFGCAGNDPTLASHLAEIRKWLDENQDEVVLLYLENTLDGDVAAHNAAAGAIEEAFGGLVYRPTSDCASLPMDTSRATIRGSGARVLIAGNCGPGTWGSWVHQRGDRWEEGGLDYGDDFTAERCADERTELHYADNFIRHWGDETGLSAAADAGGDVTVSDARNMIACGVNMPGLDNLVPFDERLEQYAWSWAPDEPSSTAEGSCASHGGDGRFRSRDCAQQTAPFACYDGTEWHITVEAGAWALGEEVCAREALGSFAVPWNGHENERLKTARPEGSDDVWLNYYASDEGWVS